MKDKNLSPKEVARIVRLAHMEGRATEREAWVGSLLPETMEITVRVRDKKDEVEAIRYVLTFNEDKYSSFNLFEFSLRGVLEKMAKGKILKNLFKKRKRDLIHMYPICPKCNGKCKKLT